MSVSSYEGGGLHGNLGLIMTIAEYFVVATDVCLPPEDPGPVATIVAGMMGIHIAEMGRLYTSVTRTYRTYNNVDQAFNKMIIDAFKDQYLNTLSDGIVGYVNCTSLQFLTHILTYYARSPQQNSRRTTSVLTRRMILINQMRISSNRFRMQELLRWPVYNLIEMR
jgi:hypothetical protein